MTGILECSKLVPTIKKFWPVNETTYKKNGAVFGFIIFYK